MIMPESPTPVTKSAAGHSIAETLVINQDGIAYPALYIASPNHDQRPHGVEIDMLVIHNISLPPQQYGGEGVIELFTNRLDPQAHPYYAEIQGLTVSSHFFIRRNGCLLQFVPCQLRAWHAGASEWKGRSRCNDFSIGIELEGSDVDAFETAQYATLNMLISALKQRYPIAHVVGHSDIAPGRKTDPGPYFYWNFIEASIKPVQG